MTTQRPMRFLLLLTAGALFVSVLLSAGFADAACLYG